MEKEKHLKWLFYSRKQVLFKFKTFELLRECTLNLCGQSDIAPQILLARLRPYMEQVSENDYQKTGVCTVIVLHWPTHAFANGSLRRSAVGKPSYRISHMVSRHGTTDIKACAKIKHAVPFFDVHNLSWPMCDEPPGSSEFRAIWGGRQRRGGRRSSRAAKG